MPYILVEGELYSRQNEASKSLFTTAVSGLKGEICHFTALKYLK
jgi:hypothetical protein